MSTTTRLSYCNQVSDVFQKVGVILTLKYISDFWNVLFLFFSLQKDRKTNRKENRKKESKTDRQKVRQGDRQKIKTTNRQMERKTKRHKVARV